MTSKRIPALFLLATIIFCPVSAHSADFIFHCSPWKEINNKKSLQNNFTIKINNSSLSILGGDLDIRFFELDCMDLDAMTDAMKGCDLVYHTAATAHEGLSVFSPNFITKNIYQASISTFTAAIKNNLEKIVFCSSMARYGNQAFPFTEEFSSTLQTYTTGLIDIS